MTDEELIKELRYFDSYSDVPDAAADRIEQLVKELDLSNELGKALEEDAGQLRAKLAKAVDVIKVILFTAHADDHESWYDALDDASTLLAELEKTE